MIWESAKIGVELSFTAAVLKKVGYHSISIPQSHMSMCTARVSAYFDVSLASQTRAG